MSWLRGAHDLGYVAARVQGAGGAASQEDWLTTVANAGGAAGKGLWYLRDKIPKIADGLKTKGPTPTPTAIIDVAIVTISVIDLLNGFLSADQGGALNTGKLEFENAVLNLKLANVNDSKWQGTGAQGYADQNKKLMELAAKMQELDGKMQEYVKDHAGHVNKAHQVIALSLMSLVLAQGIAILMWAFPIFGPGWSVAFQVLTVSVIGLTVYFYEIAVMQSSGLKSSSLEELALEYNSVATRAAPLGTFSTILVQGAEETSASVSSFKALSDQMSPFSATPTVSSLASFAMGSMTADEIDVFDALMGDGETPPDGATPEDPEVPPVPGYTPPTMADVMAASSQAAKLAGHMSQHMNIVNQTMGSMQQLASMGQQGKGTASGQGTPVEETAAAGAKSDEAPPAVAPHDGDAEGAGAAAGTERAERAPVDATGRSRTTPGIDHGLTPSVRQTLYKSTQ